MGGVQRVSERLGGTGAANTADPVSVLAPAHGLLGLMWALALLAIATPALIAFNPPPSSTYLNQAASLVGWGVWLIALASQLTGPVVSGSLWGARAALAALGLLGLAAALAPVGFGAPAGLSYSALGLIAAAGVVLLAGVAVMRSEDAQPTTTAVTPTASAARSVGLPTLGRMAFQAFCVALVLAGAVSLLIELVQYFAPEWADGNWLARPASPGRVGGNLRQPNHLSSLLLWSMAALVWLHDRWEDRGSEGITQAQALRAWPRVGSAVLMALLALGLVLTVSRTGAVCVVLLALWGAVDRRLSRFSRWMLWTLPVVYVACWLGVQEWAQLQGHAFSGGDQLNKADLSSSRFAIWSNALGLIAQNPWWGVGWGEFNFAWSLTPFPGRPVAFFDHTHNLPLQLVVELGLPLATLVMGLMLWALWCALRACWRAPLALQPMARCAVVMVLMMGVHSQLEYPLWYAYFLLPTAFALGVALGCSRAKASPGEPQRVWRVPFQVLLVASWVVTTGAVLSVIDYLPVVQVFAPGTQAASLDKRIARGQRSIFFAHHADYADATTTPTPAQAMPAFGRATHFLLDTRLMMAWAKAYADRGDLDRARYLAARLREFRNPASDSFFALCDSPVLQGDARPFQCSAPEKTLTFKDFR